MKTIVLSVLLLLALSQAQQQSQVNLEVGPIKINTSVPGSSQTSQAYNSIEASKTKPSSGSPQSQFVLDLWPNPTPSGMPNPPFPTNPEQINNQDQVIPEFPEELLTAIMIFYGVIVLGAVAVCGVVMYCCIKKANQRRKIKDRMKELQIMFAQSQNMNVFEMSTKPNFPRTVHI